MASPEPTGRVLLNPASGSAHEAAALRALVADTPGFTLSETRSAEDAVAQARAAAEGGCPLVVAAGGDGTVHAVANGLVQAGGEATLAVVPLGTGNDLARTLCLPDDPPLAFELARKGVRRRLDLLCVEADGREIVAINAVTGGFSGTVSEQLTPEIKRRWGPLAYVIGAARALTELEGYPVRLTWDGADPVATEVLNVVVANGRTAAGGQPIAPLADPEDGLLEVVLVLPGTPGELASLASRFSSGDYMDHPCVEHRRPRTLRIEADPPMWFSIDGERSCYARVAFSVRPRALEVVVGPRYTAAPPPPGA